MNLEKLHKRLAMQAMNPKDKLADIKARAIGWNVQGKFQSFAERINQMYGDAPEPQPTKVPTPNKRRKRADVGSNSKRTSPTTVNAKKTRGLNKRMGNT